MESKMKVRLVVLAATAAAAWLIAGPKWTDITTIEMNVGGLLASVAAVVGAAFGVNTQPPSDKP